MYATSSSGRVYSLDAKTGCTHWTDARITGAPVFYQQRVYVPVSSRQELSATAPGYECCKFRGIVAALDADDGKMIWQTCTIDQKPKPYRSTRDGTRLYGPAGGSVWSVPTLDPKRNLLYVGTGNSYTDVPAARSDSILALDVGTGAIRWVNQLHAQDNYVACEAPSTRVTGESSGSRAMCCSRSA